MAIDYTILVPPDGEGPLCAIITSGGEPVAFQVVVKWSERIVTALKLLDEHERIGEARAAYVEKIKKETGQPDDL